MRLRPEVVPEGAVEPRRLRSPALASFAFQTLILAIAALVAGTLFVAMGRLAVWAWDDYGGGIVDFYVHDVFGDPPMRQILKNTAIVVLVSSVLATFLGAILAWLNERTDASIGLVGRVVPLIPFLMPAIALPLGWLFLASPNAGALNVVLRGGLARIGIDLESGPLDIYGWPGLIFLYTVFLCGFSYLLISSSMRNLDPALEEAAKLAGARPVRILFRIVLPALRPAMLSAFLMCLIVAVALVSIPITIGSASNINVLSVVLVNLVTTQSPPVYGQAFLLGLLMLVPIVVAWGIQRRTARRGRFAVVGGRAASGTRLQLGLWGKIVGRAIFIGYACIAVLLPLLGLIYVSGVSFWSIDWPETWNPWTNLSFALDNPAIREAITTSVTLGVLTGALLMGVCQLLSYGQRVFPRTGQVVDGLTKAPAVILDVLMAIALLVTFGGSPFNLQGSEWLLLMGYFIGFLPFASVIATGAQQEIGRDVVEAATIAGSSTARTFTRIVTPLTRTALAGGFLLMYVLVSGETSVSLILASTEKPVVGFVMLDLFNYASFPVVASFALLITAVNLVCIAVLLRLLGGRDRRRTR